MNEELKKLMKKEIRWKERTFPDYYKKKKDDDEEDDPKNKAAKEDTAHIYKLFSYYR